jgi:phage tail sheath protein FI
MLAVLTLPHHYRESAAIEHARTLRGSEGDDAPALGYGALYHPWLVCGDPRLGSATVALPPDGAAMGLLARRASTRGAWVAPANVPLRGVLALDPEADRATLPALLDAHVNELRREPPGFLALSADTLTMDELVRPIGVRRLMMLLRRLALRYGTDYAFEPHDEELRRALRRGFEEVLALMYGLGAFAGRTADEAYQVDTGDPPNTAASTDRGELIAEVRVAPSRPLEFLTVRLVNSAERGLTVETA